MLTYSRSENIAARDSATLRCADSHALWALTIGQATDPDNRHPREDCDGKSVDCTKIKITRDTSFNLLREREEACRVDVTVLTSRRVRLDGLYVQEPSDEFVRYARYSPPSTAAQRWFGWRALNTTCF